MANFEIVRRNFTPAAVGSTETTAIYSIAKGQRVISASIKAVTAAAASTDSTVQVGDGVDPDGFITTANLDLESTAGTIAAGTGAYFGTSAAGRLYTAADTVDVVYTCGSTPGATTPTVQVALLVVREFPAG